MPKFKSPDPNEAEIQRLCDHYGISKKTFLAIALTYFMEAVEDLPNLVLDKGQVLIRRKQDPNDLVSVKAVYLAKMKQKRRWEWKPPMQNN